MKNILLIIPNMDFGGAQRSFSKLSMVLARKYRVVNVVFNKADGVAYELGGELVSLDIQASDSVFQKLINFYKRVVKVRQVKKEKSIDVAISFLEGADFVNILSKRKEKIIVSIRGSKQSDETIRGFSGWLRKKILIPFLYKKADWITSVNHGIIEELDQFFGLTGIKKKVIYNYYDTVDLAALGEEKLPEQYAGLLAKPYLIFAGRLAPEKGIDKLLKVYAQLKERSKYRFVIVGSGPMKEKLTTLCKELELKWSDGYTEELDVIFVGEQKNPHVFVSKAKIFLMGSSSEGFPNGLAEAMASGVPVVSTDCPWGPREILSESKRSVLPEYADYGILLPMLNQEGALLDQSIKIWSDTLDQLLADEALCRQYSRKGLLRIQQFNEQLHFKNWDDLIHS